MHARSVLIATLLVWSLASCKDSAQPSGTEDAKLPIVVYYTLPG